MTAAEQDKLEAPQVVNLSQVNVENVQAELVRASNSAIYKLEADEVDVNGILIGVAVAGELNGRRTVIGVVNAQQANLREAIVGGVRGETVSADGYTGAIAATVVNAPETNALIVAGAEVNATHIRTGVLLGRNINGNVETMLDTRTAILAGVFGGAVVGLVLLAGRLLFSREK